MCCQQDYQNPDNNELQDALWATTKDTYILLTQLHIATTNHYATTLVQTNVNKQIHITVELNVN